MKTKRQLQETKSAFSAVAERPAGNQLPIATTRRRFRAMVMGEKDRPRATTAGKSLLAALRSCPGDLTALDFSRRRETQPTSPARG